MKNRKSILEMIWILLLILLFGGCGRPPYQSVVVPPLGLIYTSVKAPLTTNLDRTLRMPGIKVYKKKASLFRIPFLVRPDASFGGGGIEEIAEEGGIEKVAYADYEFRNIFRFYNSYTIIVYGYGPEDTTVGSVDKEE